MLCNHCEKRPATMRVTGVMNGHAQSLDLCMRCAQRGPWAAALGGMMGMPGHPGLEADEEGGNEGSETPLLDRYARDLTAMATAHKLDPVVGREREVARLVRILVRKTKNNPVLVGEAGVGKTAVVEGLAQRIADGLVPEPLKGKRVLSLDLAGMVAGSKLRGEFEERLKGVMAEVAAQGESVFVFIDELHTVVGAGAAEGAMDAGNILKPALARGELRVIGATTRDEYRKRIEKDAALERRFQPVVIEEPTPEQARLILKGLQGAYEAHHGVAITPEALDAAVDFGLRYINERHLPDKAIDLLDEACAMVRLESGSSAYDTERELIDRLARLDKEKGVAVEAERFAEAARLQEEIAAALAAYKALKARPPEENGTRVDVAHIAAVVAEWTGIPAGRIGAEDAKALIDLEARLNKRVLGQADAVGAIARAVRRARAGLKDAHRPIGSFLFLGPTGVGKTELTKALAAELFHDENAMIRIDMSEFRERHTSARLVGAPPGYVGYDEAGQLTEAIRRKPYSVVLFDEIEKAHPDVHQLLLQIMEEGRLTDSQGKTVDFRHAVVIMTSNVGGEKLVADKPTLGFAALATDANVARWEKVRTDVLGALKDTFRPEFLNRIDETVVFHPLGKPEIGQIVEMLLDKTREKLAEQRITLVATDAARLVLAEIGFDPVYCARPLRRAIQREIEVPLGDRLLEQETVAGDTVVVDHEGDAFTFVNNRAVEPLPAYQLA